MQTVQLFDGVQDHAFTITDVASSQDGYEVAVESADGGGEHRFFVRQDADGSFRVTHGKSPSVAVKMIDNEYAERLRVTFAEDSDDDVTGHLAPPSLDLTGTVSDNDDVSGHLSLRQATSTVTLAASSAYLLLIWHLAAGGAEAHAINLARICVGC